MVSLLAVTSDPPAAGAELGQVVIATGGALIMTAIAVLATLRVLRPAGQPAAV